MAGKVFEVKCESRESVRDDIQVVWMVSGVGAGEGEGMGAGDAELDVAVVIGSDVDTEVSLSFLEEERQSRATACPIPSTNGKLPKLHPNAFSPPYTSNTLNKSNSPSDVLVITSVGLKLNCGTYSSPLPVFVCLSDLVHTAREGYVSSWVRRGRRIVCWR